MKRIKTEQYREAAEDYTGELWKPDFVVERRTRKESHNGRGAGWYWADTRQADAPNGPHKSERAAWIHLCKEYGIQVPPPPQQLPTVLCIVSGGCLSVVESHGVYVRVIDHDNIGAGDKPTKLPRGVGFEALVEEADLAEGTDYTWEKS